MARSVKRMSCLAAMLVALLLLSTAAFAQVNWSAPACPSVGRYTTYTFTNPTVPGQMVTVMAPIDSQLCPREETKGCCDKITIIGLNPSWYIEGFYELDYVFTTAGVPDEVIYRVPIDQFAADPVEFKVCYPYAHSWKSFELHIDLSITVFTDNTKTTKVAWIGNDLVNAAGVIGPGMDWDPFCKSLGCTPGYWRNHTSAWTGVSPADMFRTVFSPIPNTATNNLTMLQAVQLGGGGERAMIRHCSAAYIGALWATENVTPLGGNCIGFVAASGTEIVTAVKNAYSTKNYEAAHQFCASLNEDALCGPDGPWLNTNDGSTNGTPCNPMLKYVNTTAGGMKP
jgi:hypothetical protein